MDRNRFKKIYIEISNMCNLNCDFCVKTSRKKQSMSLDEFKIILNKIKPYTKYLYFHVLGEPLLHPMINEFIDEASKDFYVNITTNGYLINNIKTNNIRQINISLHSFNPIYNKDIDEYLDDINNFINHYKKNTYINLRLWVKSEYSKYMINYFEEKYNIKIKENENNIIDKNLYLNFDNEFVWPENNKREENINLPCHALKDHIAILSDGTITACCLDASGSINFGNIYKDNIDDVLNNDLFIKMLDGFKKNKRIHPLCKKCNFIQIKKDKS